MHWRSAVGRAYYALLHEGRAALERWGIRFPPRPDLHTFVCHRFLYAAEADLKSIGRIMDVLSNLRNQADYHLGPLQHFATNKRARLAVVQAEQCIALLDQIEADPARRAAAIQAITSAFRP